MLRLLERHSNHMAMPQVHCLPLQVRAPSEHGLGPKPQPIPNTQSPLANVSRLVIPRHSLSVLCSVHSLFNQLWCHFCTALDAAVLLLPVGPAGVGKSTLGTQLIAAFPAAAGSVVVWERDRAFSAHRNSGYCRRPCGDAADGRAVMLPTAVSWCCRRLFGQAWA